MTPTFAIPGSTNLVAQLANPAARALALATGAGLALAAFRVRATAVRLFTWRAVLYTALAMPLLAWTLPPLPVSMPVFLRVGATRTESAAAIPPVVEESSLVAGYEPSHMPPSESSKQASTRDLGRPHSYAALSPTPAVSPSTHLMSIPWSTLAIGTYLTVALLLLARLIVGIVLGRRLRRASQPIHDIRLVRSLASRADAYGLAFLPRVAESELISVPVTMGVLRSRILLPSSWREWEDVKLDAVVAHEISHVARRDALTQRLALLHRAIFWFSPLAWWLDRHLADLAEQASDEAALSCGTDRNAYARTLLGFFEALQAAPGRVWWQGVSMAKVGQAEKRLERILAWRGAVTMGLKKSIAVAIIALAVPVVYLAASVRPADRSQSSTVRSQDPSPAIAPSRSTPAAEPLPDLTPEAAEASTPEAFPAPAADAQSEAAPAPAASASSPADPPAPSAPVGARVSSDGPAPVRPIAPAPPVAALADRARALVSAYGRGNSYAYRYDDGEDDEERFVIASGASGSYTMSGSSEDIHHVEKLKKQITGDFIWFQRDEKSYIIRDQATIDRARKLWQPQEELGKKQEALGKLQEALGKQQEELAARMEKIRVNVPDMSAEMDKLRAELKELSSGATVDQIGKIQSEIGELQSKIGEIQSHAGDQQGKLGEEMGALGEKQGKLGEQQGELGRQQGELARKAARQMKQLLDEALKNGTAQPEPGGSASL